MQARLHPRAHPPCASSVFEAPLCTHACRRRLRMERVRPGGGKELVLSQAEGGPLGTVSEVVCTLCLNTCTYTYTC